MVPAGFHAIEVGETKVVVNIRGVEATRDSAPVLVDPITSSFRLSGAQSSLSDYVTAWVNETRSARCNRFPSGTAGEGTHALAFRDERTFAIGELVVNDMPVKSIELTGTVQVHVAKAIVVSAFEVAKRGRVITVNVDIPAGQIKAHFVQVRA